MGKQDVKSGFGKSASQLGARAMEALQYRLELLGIELGEEKQQVIRALIGAIVAAVLVFVGLMSLNLLLGVIFWDRRVLVFGVLTAVYLGGGVLLAMAVWRSIKKAPTPFAATLEALRKDASAFRSEE